MGETALRVIPYLQTWQVGAIVVWIILTILILRSLYAIKLALVDLGVLIKQQGKELRAALTPPPQAPAVAAPPEPGNASPEKPVDLDAPPRDEVEKEILRVYGKSVLRNHRKANG